MTSDKIIDDLLRREGSEYTDRPNDRGGPTKYGITQRSWEDYCRRAMLVPAGSVRNLTETQARGFYDAQFIKPLAWIKNGELLVLVVDCAVNHGPSRAIQWVQQAAGVDADGFVGPVTQSAVNSRPFDVHAGVLKRRFEFYAELVTDDPKQLEFLRGWISRACEFIS